MQLQLCSSSNSRELFRAFFYFNTFIFLQKSYKLNWVSSSDDHFPQWAGILKQGINLGQPFLVHIVPLMGLPGTRWWPQGGGSCWEPPNTTSMWPSWDFTHHPVVCFCVFLTGLHLTEFHDFLGCTQKTDIDPRVFATRTNPISGSSPWTAWKGACSSNQSKDQPTPSPEMAWGRELCGRGGGEGGRHALRAFPSQACWGGCPKPGTITGGSGLTAPTGLCTGTPHNAEQSGPPGHSSAKLDVKRWQPNMSRVGRKHRGFHFHVQGTICLPNSNGSFWGHSFRWQMVIKLLFTLTVDSS